MKEFTIILSIKQLSATILKIISKGNDTKLEKCKQTPHPLLPIIQDSHLNDTTLTKQVNNNATVALKSID